MTADHFEATFVLTIDRATAWQRLTEHPLDSPSEDERYWLPGFDSSATVAEQDAGTRLHPPLYDVMAVGWRHIVADLETYLATGAHARRHLRPWGDLGADVTAAYGGLRVSGVRTDTLADRPGQVEAEWVRKGALQTAVASTQ